MEDLRLRFFNKEGLMVYVGLNDLLTTGHPQLLSNVWMIGTGLKEKESNKEVYKSDIIALDVLNLSENAGFWDSNIGRVMKEKAFDEVIVVVSTSQYLEIDFFVLFKKDGCFVTENIFYNLSEDDPEYETSEKKIYVEKDKGTGFIRYLLYKGAKIIGNKHENPELLPEGFSS